LTERCKLKC